MLVKQQEETSCSTQNPQKMLLWSEAACSRWDKCFGFKMQTFSRPSCPPRVPTCDRGLACWRTGRLSWAVLREGILRLHPSPRQQRGPCFAKLGKVNRKMGILRTLLGCSFRLESEWYKWLLSKDTCALILVGLGSWSISLSPLQPCLPLHFCYFLTAVSVRAWAAEPVCCGCHWSYRGGLRDEAWSQVSCVPHGKQPPIQTRSGIMIKPWDLLHSPAGNFLPERQTEVFRQVSVESARLLSSGEA